MSDVHTKQQRSYNMSQIKGVNTKPEICVRSIIHRMGYRFRLHRKDLPGKPDIVLPKHKKIVFVNGCFWHMHNCRYGKVRPKTNAEFWHKKRMETKERDRRSIRKLRQLGWEVLVVWECWIKRPGFLQNKLNYFLQR